MGLDDIELVMRIEETFHVEIPESILFETKTVGNFYYYLLGLMQTRMTNREGYSTHTQGRCLSSHIFYQVRRFFQKTAHISKQDFRLDQPLDQLIPWWRRRMIWEQLQKETEYKLPQLKIPGWLLGALAILIGLLLVQLKPDSISIALGEIFVLIVVAGLIAWPLAICFPVGTRTVRDLMEHILALDWRLFTPEIHSEIYKILLCVIEEELNVSRHHIKPESTWYGDLALG